MKLLIVTMILTLLANMNFAETIYKSVDKQGNVTFSDQPIAGNRDTKVKTLPNTQLSPEQQKRAATKRQQLQKADQALSEQLQAIRQQRQRLRQQIAEAKIAVNQAEESLQVAMKRQRELARSCRQRNVQCNLSSLGPLQSALNEAKTNLRQLELQYRNLKY